MAEWSKATVSKIVVGATSPRVQIPLSPPFFCQKKMAERRRKSSLHCAVRHNFTSSRGDSRSSLNDRYALLVKSLPLVACEDVSLSLHLWSCRLSAGGCVIFYCASLTRRQAALIFPFAVIYYVRKEIILLKNWYHSTYANDRQVVTHKLFPCVFCLTNWIMDDMLLAVFV